MPADALSGLAEVIAALIQAMVEALLLIAELIVELAFLLVELVLFLIGRGRGIGRPDWIGRRRASGASRIKSLVVAVLFLSAGSYLAFQSFGYTRLSFTQGGFSRPDGVELVLIRDETSQVAVIADGKLKVRRGRWDRLVVRDARYHPADFTITGRRMDVKLEKIQTTREAATEAVVDKAAELLRKKFGKDREPDSTEDSR
jgi:hypothetical protein